MGEREGAIEDWQQSYEAAMLARVRGAVRVRFAARLRRAMNFCLIARWLGSGSLTLPGQCDLLRLLHA